MISIGIGYIYSHVVSTKFAIDITLLSLYWVTSNHPVIGSIIVTDFKFRFYFCLFLHITQGPIVSTQSLFHGIYSASLSGNLSYFIFYPFLHWQVSKLVTSFWTEFIMTCKYRCWRVITSILYITGWRRYVWYQCNTQFWKMYRITILSLNGIRFIYRLLPPQKEPLWYVPYLYLAKSELCLLIFLFSFKLIGPS